MDCLDSARNCLYFVHLFDKAFHPQLIRSEQATVIIASALRSSKPEPHLLDPPSTHKFPKELYMASILPQTSSSMADTGAAASEPLASNNEQNISYAAERIIGNGSFGVVFEAKVVETGEIVAIKKVLQDKRFKNRELQIMKQLVKDPHPNIVALKHCFYSQVRSTSFFWDYSSIQIYSNQIIHHLHRAINQTIYT